MSSGEIVRHRLSRAGDRQLNYCLNVMAITQIRQDTPGRAYYLHKRINRKNQNQAMRCLKRRLPNTDYRHWSPTPSHRLDTERRHSAGRNHVQGRWRAPCTPSRRTATQLWPVIHRLRQRPDFAARAVGRGRGWGRSRSREGRIAPATALRAHTPVATPGVALRVYWDRHRRFGGLAREIRWTTKGSSGECLVLSDAITGPGRRRTRFLPSLRVGRRR